MYGLLDVATSALVAHRTHLEIISGNIAMKDTMRFENGEPVPSRRRVALYAPARLSAPGGPLGVKITAIVEDSTPFGLRWAPEDPFAYKTGPNKGKVPLSNVDYTTEMVDAMAAQRAYEANVTVIEMIKSMVGSTLRLIA